MGVVRHIYNAVFQPEKKLIFPPKRNTAAVALLLLGPSALLPFWLLPWPLALALAVVLCFASLVLLILFVELWFRLAHKKVYGFKYKYVVPEQPDNESFAYESHPFISYVRKPGFSREGLKEESNRFRATFARGGAREVETPKPEGVYRVICLGASETAFYEPGPEGQVSYPALLENKLRERFPQRRIEVYNFATAGFTSVEILIEFMLNSIEAQPDMVIIYQGYNEVRAFLTPGFTHDYSHFRRNFAQEYERMRISGLLPLIPLHFYNFLLWQSVCVPPPSRVVGEDVHYAVTRGKMDIEAEPRGLGIYRRNLEHIINICKANGIDVVLSTFCHFFDDDSRADAERLKWENKVREVVLLENQVVSELATKHGLPMVDNFNLIPQDKKYFRDKIHFTVEGMHQMAANLADAVLLHISHN